MITGMYSFQNKSAEIIGILAGSLDNAKSDDPDSIMDTSESMLDDYLKYLDKIYINLQN